ncbi:MAG: 50S ribosomal protein L19 [Candidatus Moraniibacteriota bacterium]
MNQKLIAFNLAERRTDLPELRAGDVVRISRKIKEGAKERIQNFEGMVIALKGHQSSSPTITVRKVTAGIGVELILPLNSPQISSIELVKRTRARRAKLYFTRDKSSKVIGKKLKEVSKTRGASKTTVEAVAAPEVIAEPVAEVATEAAE